MTTKFWKPIGSSKLIRHPKWNFFAPVNSTGRGILPPPSTGRLQLLCQCFFQAMRGSTQKLSNWLVRPAHADTLAPRPPAHRRACKILTDYNQQILTFHSINDYFALLKVLNTIPLIFITISKTNYLLIKHLICTTPDKEQIVILILHYLIIQKLKNVICTN